MAASLAAPEPHALTSVVDRDRAHGAGDLLASALPAPLPQLVRTVQAVAVARSRDSDLEHAARRLRLPGHLVRKWNGEGLALIARGLLSDRVRIF
jgi:hypothetical protein